MYRFFSISILFIMFLSTGCFTVNNESQEATEEVVNTEVKNRRNILFFGNSITAAYGIDPSLGFVNLIQQKIDTLGLNYRCINAGNSGETTTGGLERLEWVLAQPISILVLELGANDALRGIDPELSKANLKRIILQFREANPQGKVLLLGMKSPPSMGIEYTLKFDPIYEQLATELSLARVPFVLQGVAGNPDLNLPDGLHPNEEGQLIIADNIWSVLSPMLKPLE
jgi:acyl-CoA thioesterase-1